MVHMHNSVCHLVKSEMLMFVAAQPLALSVMLNNQISTPEKLDAPVGRDAAQLFVALL
jgi:hypothetical protein